jgi:hypothetical protein
MILLPATKSGFCVARRYVAEHRYAQTFWRRLMPAAT